MTKKSSEYSKQSPKLDYRLSTPIQKPLSTKTKTPILPIMGGININVPMPVMPSKQKTPISSPILNRLINRPDPVVPIRDTSQPAFNVGQNVAVPLAAEGASKYAAQMNLYRPKSFSDVLVNIPQAIRIAKEYEAAPSMERRALDSYKNMAEETKRQFDYMTRPISKGGLGVDVSVSENDPYKKAAEMMEDANQSRFKVLSTKTTGGHPFFTDDENDMFRAVHDFFGHAATGRGFDPHGEEAAYRSHSAMFSPRARGAMTTETRGQNSALNYGTNKGEFPEQKIALLDTAQFITPIGRRAEFVKASKEAKLAHERMLKGFKPKAGGILDSYKYGMERGI